MSETSKHAQIGEAWDIIAREKYRHEVEDHVAHLRSGGHNLLEPELEILDGLLPGARVIHLQCSHGFDALGLLNAGAASVVGIDISGEMIEQARIKAAKVGASRASFIQADAIDPPDHLAGTADLIYTGRGSLPWIMDLAPWARAVQRLLGPGGRIFVFEGHPLTFLWDRQAEEPRLREGVGYFDHRPAEQPGFPASAVKGASGSSGPAMPERPWRPGEVIDALQARDVRLELYRESPVLFWDQFSRWPEHVRSALPNSYAILARTTLE